MKRVLLSLLLVVSALSSLFAVKAYPYLITATQPDGTTISYYLKGDESFSYATTEDGLLIARNAEGVFEYAYVSNFSQINTTGVKAAAPLARDSQEQLYVTTLPSAEKMLEAFNHHNAAVRKAQQARAGGAVRSYPLSGNPKSLVILANYTDVKFTVPNPAQKFSDMLNKPGYSENYGTGSARDYFSNASNGVFAPDFVVVGPYDLPHEMSYYGEHVGSTNDKNARQMIIDACKAANDDVDFSEFDTDNDGNLDNVFVFYAGHNEAEGASPNSVWPHRSSVMGSLTLDGVRIMDYACTSEYKGSGGGSSSMMAGISTFCHEFGHVLGLPDFYDTDYSGHATLGSWDIMDQGSYNNGGRTPPTYSAYERFFLGWMTPTILTDGAYTLEPLSTSNTAFIVTETGTHNLDGASPNPLEFFMVENRQYDNNDGVPATGMLVTRVVYSHSDWNNNRPNNNVNKMGVVIMCAHGTTYTPESNTYPGSRNVTQAHFTLRDGTRLLHTLKDIAEIDNIISFTYGESNISLDTTYEDFLAYYGETKHVQTLKFSGLGVTENVRFQLSKGADYKLRLHNDEEDGIWRTFADVTPGPDSTFSCLIDVVLDPTRIYYGDDVTDRLDVISGSNRMQFPLRGRSLRPVKVVPPVAYEAESITPYSFKAHWSPVFDAKIYYLTVYNILDKPSTQVEEFSTFDQEVPEGWSANFNAVDKSYKQSNPQSVFFSKPTETLETKEYFMDVDKISMWLYSISATGRFRIEAFVDTAWTPIHEEVITLGTRSKTLEVNVEQPARRFRFCFEIESGKGLAFDDFTAYFPLTYNYVCRDTECADTVTTVGNLSGLTEYKYYVKASDRDEKGRYENITAPSNEVVVKTIDGLPAGSKNLSISIDEETGLYSVFVDELLDNHYIYIYSLGGQMVAEIPVTTNAVIIPVLKENTTYIVKYSERGKMRRKDKYAKFFYHLR